MRNEQFTGYELNKSFVIAFSGSLLKIAISTVKGLLVAVDEIELTHRRRLSKRLYVKTITQIEGDGKFILEP
tara:strand:+ start:180 stop:395 length:216 start_codon:yes stop_codon:yes gene_type:complete